MAQPLGFQRSILTALAFSTFSFAAHAAEVYNKDDVKLSLGFGARVQAVSNGDQDFSANMSSLRLYSGASYKDWLKLEFNTELDGEDDIHLLDAVVKAEANEAFNVWAGRFLPPSDRSNLSGPYYLGQWNFPIAQAYPAIFAGRDNGLAVWGQFQGGQYKYQAGVFAGREGAFNPNHQQLFAGRIVINFLDPEPGYYNSSTYYGEKDILALGFTVQSQKDAATDLVTTGDFTGWSLDGLFERKFQDWVATVEGTYYNYDTDDVNDPTLRQGKSWFLLGALLAPQKFGLGKVQPTVRYATYDSDFLGTSKTWDFGVNYIINAHNLKFSLMWQRSQADTSAPWGDAVVAGLQLQF